jgi:hypothetical protein
VVVERKSIQHKFSDKLGSDLASNVNEEINLGHTNLVENKGAEYFGDLLTEWGTCFREIGYTDVNWTELT